MTDLLDQRIAALDRLLDTAPPPSATPPSDADRCRSNIYIIGAIVPLLTWMVLYFWKPSIVRNANAEHEKVNSTKVFFYTVLFTGLAWAALYLLSKHTSFGRICPV